MTRRAKRLEEYLRNKLGWDTGIDYQLVVCAKNPRHASHDAGAKFCVKCGSPTTPKADNALKELEAALVYALKLVKK